MQPPTVSRRDLLATVGATATAGLAGCTGSTGSDPPSDGTYLAEPDREYGADALPYPAHGQELPTATVPAPLQGESYTLPDDFAGRDTLVTFIYTNCMTMCPRLTAVLANLQGHAADEGYGDRMAFADITFDPARDDADRFREYADTYDIDLDADNWYFLRPDGEDRAKEVVTDTYGVVFQKDTPEDMDQYMFTHLGLILLVNKSGLVERSYKFKSAGVGDPITWQDVEDDLATLREREE